MDQQQEEKWIQDEDLERKNYGSFSDRFWQKLREEMLMEIIIDKKPLKNLKLYEIEPQDLLIDLEKVKQWSVQNSQLYHSILENGFADFICNKEYLQEFYKEIVFDNQQIVELDKNLKNLVNLEVLKISKNSVQQLQNLPSKLKELYIFENSLTYISPKLKSENLLFLGLGYNKLEDQALTTIGFQFPNLLCLDLCYNHLSQIDATLENLTPLTRLKMLTTYGNPIALLPNYYKGMRNGLAQLEYFDEIKLQKQNTGKKGISYFLNDEDNNTSRQQEENQNKRMTLDPTNTDKPDFEQFNSQMAASITQFTIQINIETLENVQGINLDKDTYSEEIQKENPHNFSTHFWVEVEISQNIKKQSDKVSFEKLFIDPEEKNRLPLNAEILNCFQIDEKSRDIIRKGVLITLFKSEPIQEQNEETEELAPVLDENGVPKIQESKVGICRIDTSDWLKYTQNKRHIQQKFNLFPAQISNLPELWVPVQNENLILEKHKKKVQELLLQQEEANKPKEPEEPVKDDKNKKATKKKDAKKDTKKKDAKKKGKDEPEEPQVPLLDWEINQRKQIFVDENDIKLTNYSPLLLAVSAQIQSAL